MDGIFIFATVLLAGYAPAGQGDAPASRAAVDRFLTSYCVVCHGEKDPKGEFSLAPLVNGTTLASNRGDWEEVLNRITDRDMPPENSGTVKRPAPAEYDSVAEWILNELEKSAPAGARGRRMRRLNRTEYNNTIRDLLAVDYRPADLLPIDLERDGFDNVADVQTLSTLHVEKYLIAARETLNRAIVRTSRPEVLRRKFYPLNHMIITGITKPKASKAGLEKLSHEDLLRVTLRPIYHSLNELRDGKGEHGYELALPRNSPHPFNHIHQAGIEARIVHRGPYKIRISAYMDRRSSREMGYPRMSLYVDGSLVHRWVVRQENEPRSYEFVHTVEPGLLRVMVSHPNMEKTKANAEQAPFLVICGLDLSGPHHEAWPPTSHTRLFGRSGGLNDREVLARFLPRAFRRPVSPAEVDRYSAIADAERARGRTGNDSVQTALQAALVSPHFLYLVEDPTRETSGDFELASRLSYFLWSSMPDRQLFDLARDGKLRDSGILATQIERLLRDPRGRAFTENFAGQWLSIRRMKEVMPEPSVYPEFDSELRDSMQMETLIFFQDLLDRDRSIFEFIDSRFVYVNERLARHYGIPGIRGTEFQRVELGKHSGRGGVLAQAGVLTVTSEATRSSPIYRGKFILERFLNRRLPPAPANAGRLPEQAAGIREKPLREQLALHRRAPSCAGCHRKIDPWGLPLEEFDGIGARRPAKSEEDITGMLPGNRRMIGLTGLKRELLGRKQEFARALTEHLLVYALGRALDIRDRRYVKMILERAEKENYRFRALLRAIVLSPSFRGR